MKLYEEQFSGSHDFPRQERPDKTLIIASTPRCGSHMLGHTLHETGAFGFPLEYANPANLREWKRRIEMESTEEVIRELTQRRTSPNGVFGIKLHYTHINVLGGFDGVQALFPEAYYVLLSRKDVLKQAVSLAIAKQTGVWIAGQQPERVNLIWTVSSELIQFWLGCNLQQSASGNSLGYRPVLLGFHY